MADYNINVTSLEECWRFEGWLIGYGSGDGQLISVIRYLCQMIYLSVSGWFGCIGCIGCDTTDTGDTGDTGESLGSFEPDESLELIWLNQ